MALNSASTGAVKKNRLIDGDRFENPIFTIGQVKNESDYACDGTVDDNIVIQECFDEIADNNGGAVHINSGTYNYSNSLYGVSIDIPSDVKVNGNGSATILKDITDVELKTNFEKKGILKAVSKENIEILSLKLQGYHNLTTDDEHASGNGIWCDTCSRINLHDLWFKDGFHAIGMHDTNKVTLSNIDVINNEHGLYLKNSDGVLINNYRVTKDAGFLQRGLYFHYCRNVDASNINVYNADTAGIYIRTEGVIPTEPCYNLKFSNTTCISDDSTSSDEVCLKIEGEGNTISDIKFDNGYFSAVNGSGALSIRSYTDQAGLISDLRFEKCTFYCENGNGGGTTSTLGVTTKMFSNLYFEDCLFHSKNKSGANFSFCDNLVFKNCHFKSEDLTSTYAGIIMRYCSNITFIDCWFDGASKDFSFLSDCTNIKVINPRMTSGVWENNGANTADIELSDEITGSNPIKQYTKYSYINTTGANTVTLADGMEGMEKIITIKTFVDKAILTPATANGFSVIYMASLGATAHLRFINSAWTIVSTTGCVIGGGINEISLSDDASITVKTATAGFGFVQAGDNEEWAQFTWKADGTVFGIQNSTNVAYSNTDNNLAIYDNGTGIVIKNRLGATKIIRYNLQYS